MGQSASAPMNVTSVSTEIAKENGGKTSTLMLASVGGALVLSALVLFFATSSWILAGVYAAGLSVLLLGVIAAERLVVEPAAAEQATPDWSVTVAAIEQHGEAIAITDRANRLVCANPDFIETFGAESAPPSMPFERPQLEAMSRLAREARCATPAQPGIRTRSEQPTRDPVDAPSPPSAPPKTVRPAPWLAAAGPPPPDSTSRDSTSPNSTSRNAPMLAA